MDGRTQCVPAKIIITLHLLAALLPLVHLGTILQESNPHAAGHLYDVKENMIPKTRPTASIAWFSSDALMSTVCSFRHMTSPQTAIHCVHELLSQF